MQMQLQLQTAAKRTAERIRSPQSYVKPLPQWQLDELDKCRVDPAYFINTYCKIYDAEASNWIPFDLWTSQREALQTVHDNQLSIILKARQIGLTWLLLSYALWLMLFKPIAVILVFSRRDDDAKYLLGEERLRGIYKNLPAWMQTASITTDSAHQFTMSNGSTAYAFPTTGGDSYTATLAIVDEADLIEDLARLLRSVKPTIEAGGKLALISRADKRTPASAFKSIYRGAKVGENAWKSIFLPWDTHPKRTQEWYQRQCADAIRNTGTLDDVYEQYPATDTEALSPRSLDKRIPPEWMMRVYLEARPLESIEGSPAIDKLRIYKYPDRGRVYRVGADPAEGNPTSDDSACEITDANTGEEVASLAGKYQPSTFAAHIAALSAYYNNAEALVERNNHGHAVLLWLRDNSKVRLIKGWDDKEGWLSNSRGKSLLYSTAADCIRDGVAVIHDFDTQTQLGSIEGSTLLAPVGQHDDKADAYALSLQAGHMRGGRGSGVIRTLE